MNAITTTAPSSISLQPLPEKVDAALTRMLNGIDRVGLRSEIPAHLAPTAEQKAYLGKLAAERDGALCGAGVELARMEIGVLFDVMKIRAADELTLTARIEVYASDLASLPAFALSKACSDYRTAVVGDGVWAPTPGELRKHALLIAEPVVKERGRIRQVLAAEPAKPIVVNESKRAAALALAKQVADEMRNRPDPLRPKEHRQLTRKEAEEWIEREKASPHCPAPSDALRSILNLPNTDMKEEAA